MSSLVLEMGTIRIPGCNLAMSVGSAVNFSTEARLSNVGDLVSVDFEVEVAFDVEVESCSPCSGSKSLF